MIYFIHHEMYPHIKIETKRDEQKENEKKKNSKTNIDENPFILLHDGKC